VSPPQTESEIETEYLVCIVEIDVQKLSRALQAIQERIAMDLEDAGRLLGVSAAGEICLDGSP
jgi:hypothetical protein